MAHGRPVALAATAVLVSEAAGVAVLHWILGVMVDRQDMSLAGLDPRVAAVSAWAGGAVLAVLLLLCGALLLRTALTGRAPGRPARVLLAGVAVGHGVLGAVAAALVGWAAFAVVMAALGVLVLALSSPVSPAGGQGAEGAGDTAPGAAGAPLRPTTP
ncbi:hypothetical protein CUT44_16825 [Streptomyces carminius]|uniref:Uncharacterized protein n=1 Tax=Streptomyces carminius TaxID=2665496 RepID=A0A2M8LXJ8_9ACTN|nr:hypothetical protein [Streptomyces carminius]PJE96698.1 hypothetical protein CUT44_16825 [Streptomyces carminius]